MGARTTAKTFCTKGIDGSDAIRSDRSRAPRRRSTPESSRPLVISPPLPQWLAAAEIAATGGSSDTEFGCPLPQPRIRRHDFGLVAFGQVHRMNAGFLRQLLEQAVETVLIDGV